MAATMPSEVKISQTLGSKGVICGSVQLISLSSEMERSYWNKKRGLFINMRDSLVSFVSQHFPSDLLDINTR